MAGLVFQWLKRNGGLANGKDQHRQTKAIYDVLEGGVLPQSGCKGRSFSHEHPLHLPDESLDEPFLKAAKQRV
jgi:phosphoserine aminotransferase